MTDQIIVPTAQIDPCLHIYGNTALAYVMRLKPIDGEIAFVADRPVSTFSSGEQVLWSALAVLAAGEPLTDADLLRVEAACDTDNAAAVRAATQLAAA